ncbi:MAG: hypothetical protein VXZ96_10260 [Myxococcota bacterium]|nr:hypothetical protein [Myxococcota bacterium]
MSIGYRAKSGPQLKLFWYSLAWTILLTAPTLFLPVDLIWGAYPTLDKKTSLLMYLDHAHGLPIDNIDVLKGHTPLFLIGIHISHLWVTEIFDVLFSTCQSINFHSLFNLWLSTFVAGLFIERRIPNHIWCSLIGGLSFGLSLHQFREIQWYTIEKTGIYWLPLFLFVLDMTIERKSKSLIPALIWMGSAMYNLYASLLLAGCGFIYGLFYRTKTAWFTLSFCILAGMTIGGLQYTLMTLGPEIATEVAFQNRAALDTVQLWPPMWNRLEMWCFISPLMVIGLWVTTAKKQQNILDLAIALSFVLLSFGPELISGVRNPVYLMFSQVPGMWRMAKPEFFFTVVYLLLCLWMAKGLSILGWNSYPKRLLTAFVLIWVISCRLHPVYPEYSQYKPAKLDPNWEERVFQGPTDDEHLLPTHQK